MAFFEVDFDPSPEIWGLDVAFFETLTQFMAMNENGGDWRHFLR